MCSLYTPFIHSFIHSLVHSTPRLPALKELTTPVGRKRLLKSETTRSKAPGNRNTHVTSQALFTGEVQHLSLYKKIFPVMTTV